MTAAFRVGLTGGIASGKSTVRRLLAEAGFETVDADEVVAELYRPGGKGAAAVERLFGAGYLSEEGAVDHEALAGLVFADATARRKLEGEIHPLVRGRWAEIAASKRGTGAVVVLEATLLVEAGYAPDFDLVVTVEADEDVRVARAVARGAREEHARARLAAQGDGAARRRHADRVLRNDGGLEDLNRQVAALVEEIRGLALEHAARGAEPPDRGRHEEE